MNSEVAIPLVDEAPPPLLKPLMDISLEQLHDNTLKNALDQVVSLDGQSIQAGAALTLSPFYYY